VADIFVNGVFYGETNKPKELVEELRKLRREGKLIKELSVYYDQDNDIVKIEYDKGRVLRPLIVVKNGKPLFTKEHLEKIKKGELTWDDLVKEGVIEYLDAAEEENAYIALNEEELTKEHTHLEIHPTVIFGLLTSYVPFANHDSASRLLRGVKTQKQGLGYNFLNFHARIDNDVSILHYPQIPLVQTYTMKYTDIMKKPMGMNVVLAVMTYDGYNIEDALVFNKGSIDRGLFRAHYFKSYEAAENRYLGGLKDRITVPSKDVKNYLKEEYYRHLEEDGIIYPEAKVKRDEVLIGKVSPPKFSTSLEELGFGLVERDASVQLKQREGVVDQVIITENEDKNLFVRVKVREHRIPEVGDKFSSKHGQKGVIGLIVPEADMPFTASGIVPDIIFSPHSLPSRRTVGYLLELLTGKAAAVSGKYIDATPFDPELSEKEIKNLLEKHGFKRNGTEIMYNPITGERYKVDIYIGSIYYMRLKHMVSDKMHARSRGPVTLLTRQPTEGKARLGGLRLGEMEQQALVAHGASLLFRERFSSDQTKVIVCDKCGVIGWTDRKGNKVCPICGTDTTFSEIEVSYAFKLFLDELLSMHIYPKIKTKYKWED
jgi:DNA-directed RNA polymerase subunit B